MQKGSITYPKIPKPKKKSKVTPDFFYTSSEGRHTSSRWFWKVGQRVYYLEKLSRFLMFTKNRNTCRRRQPIHAAPAGDFFFWVSFLPCFGMFYWGFGSVTVSALVGLCFKKSIWVCIISQLIHFHQFCIWFNVRHHSFYPFWHFILSVIYSNLAKVKKKGTLHL